MWIRAFLLASLCGSLLTSSVSQATIRFARFPAPSPDGKQVAFSWQGDLWLAPIAGGVAQRLTVHPAYDFAPIWSPDGKKIAFTSDRHGNDDVFVLHLDTGAVQRLTYFSARDRAWGWTPDSRAVLFESRRESEPYGADFGAYVAPLDGGTPYRLHKASGSPFALSPDGKRLAFVRRDSAWWRKGYKGSAQGDLWLLERATNRYVRLTDTDTPDTFPLWGADGRTLYFVSERDGTANLYAMDANTRRIRQLTRFKDDGIRFPQISANGAVITFEQGMDVYRLDTATGAIQPIPLQVPAQDARAAETGAPYLQRECGRLRDCARRQGVRVRRAWGTVRRAVPRWRSFAQPDRDGGARGRPATRARRQDALFRGGARRHGANLPPHFG
jgi:tricorn protease